MADAAATTTTTGAADTSAAGALTAAATTTAATGAATTTTTPAADTTTTTTLTPEQQAAADAAANEPPPLKMPGKDAKPEDWQAFYKQLGKPETADAYEVTQPEGDDPAIADLVKQMFHKANILPEQAKALLEFRNEIFAKNAAAAAAQQQAAEQALHSKNTAEAAALANEWGQANTANMEMAKRAISQFVPGEPPQKAALVSAIEGVLGYKETIKFFQGIGKGLGEGDAAGLGEGSHGTSRKSAAEILYGGTTK